MFMIIRNHVDPEVMFVRVRSSNCTLPSNLTEEEIQKELPYPFRLYDDDGNLQFEGFYDGLMGDSDHAFEPLDTMQPSSGCTELHYLEKGEWKLL